MIIIYILVFLAIFFVWIPKNHMVCIAVFGKPQRMLCSRKDRQTIRDEITKKKALLDAFAAPTSMGPATKSIIAKIKKDLEDIEELNKQIVCREDSIIGWFFVKFLNLHFKSFNPLAGFKKVNIIRNKANEENTVDQAIADRVKHLGTKTSIYLRIAFPRIGFAPDRQFAKNMRNHLAWTVNRVVIINPHYIFWENSDVSLNVDTQINAALNTFTPCFLFAEFEAEDTGTGDNRLNSYFRDEPTLLNDKDATGATVGTKLMFAGAYKFGFSVNSIGILDYELGKDQQAYTDALTEQEAAKVKLETTKLQAEGEAALIEGPGMAKARVMKAQAQSLAGTVGANNAGAILQTEAYGGKITTLVNGNGAGVILPAAVPPAPPTPPTPTPVPPAPPTPAPAPSPTPTPTP